MKTMEQYQPPTEVTRKCMWCGCNLMLPPESTEGKLLFDNETFISPMWWYVHPLQVKYSGL